MQAIKIFGKYYSDINIYVCSILYEILNVKSSCSVCVCIIYVYVYVCMK
jgi:hypothetical protein